MIQCEPITRFQFPSLEPAFSTYLTLIKQYNVGFNRCDADDEDPWFHRFPLITYLRNVTPPTQYTDDLHMEVADKDKRWEQYEFRCHVTVNPKEQELTKFGLDERVELLCYPSLPVLEEVGLAVQGPGELYVGTRKVIPSKLDFTNGPIRFLLSPGDRLWWAHNLYECLTVHEWNYFGNTNIPLYCVISASRYRPSTSDIEAGRTF